jgi:peptidoglycan-associated lipoprotein
MNQITRTARGSWPALFFVLVALIVGGCATTRSYTPEIDRMRTDLAEAKAAGAQTLAPDEYARAESCLDWWTHYVTQFDHIGDGTMANLPARCRTAMQALKSKMAVAPVAIPDMPAPPPPPVEAPQAEMAPPLPPAPPAPEVDRGIYPKEGTLGDAMAALPATEAPPGPLAVEAVAVAPPAPEVDRGIYPKEGTLGDAMAALPATDAPPGPAVTPPAPMAAREAEKKPPLGDIFFDYDQSLIRPDAKKTLEKNIAWLRANTKPNLMIEGHCDERGTQEYNLALGQRRAKAAQDYLVASGIDEKRIKTISYGKERPFVVGHDESAWQWNRRAHFLLP